MRTIDLRSDTVTRPTPAMRAQWPRPRWATMCSAKTRPSTAATSDRRNAGQGGGLFVPSGTMSNQIGVRVHCQPGDEFICETGCHIYNYEQGAYAS